jgi:7-cyano-7-deazaguanine synthase
VTQEQPNAVVLLSGGLDSTTVLAMAQAEGFAVRCLTFRYGQRHDVELAAAQRVADAAGVDLKTIELDLRAFGGSALTADVEVPKGRSVEDIEAHVTDGEVPVTYVPARNTIFLSFALAYAETLGANHLFLGANQLDYSGYPDCRPLFVRAFEVLANVATAAKEHIHVVAPLMDMDKAAIIQTGHALGVDYALTHSCYDPQGDLACGACDACVLRKKGFADAGVDDPTRYV